jgi:RNA recognition motif-containing protein
MDAHPNQWTPSTNVFLNHIPKTWSKCELLQLCSPFGPIESAKVIIDLATGNSKGFGFVRYAYLDSAIFAVSKLNGAAIDGSRLLARFASCAENTGVPTNTIRVRSLPLAYQRIDIWKLYSRFGEIVGLEPGVNKRTGLFGGSAVITFKTRDAAVRAVRETNNVKLQGNEWPLFVQYCERPTKCENALTVAFGIRVEKRC